MKKRRNTQDFVVIDRDGRPVGGDETARRNRIGTFFGTFIMVLSLISRAVRDAITRWWNNLAVPKTISEEEEQKKKIFRKTRDQIAYVVLFGALLLIFGGTGKIPFLIVATGFVEVVALIGEAMVKREAVMYGEKLDEANKDAVKSAAGLIRAFVILVLLLSVMAWAVKAGHLNSVTGVFPWLENFADWQISKVNEVVEFLREFFSKK